MDKWPKHKSGIRSDYAQQPVIRSLQSKWNALFIVTMLQGSKEDNLWKQKRPKTFVAKLDREIKLKTSVLENPPELFASFKHPAGCSLQYLIMLAECLGGADWYEPFINRHDEADIAPAISKDKVEVILAKITESTNLVMEHI